MTYARTGTLKYFLLLLIVIIPLFSLGLSNHGLWSADEPRVAEISREMAVSGNWAVPMLNQKPFLEEPPLYYGALALTFKAFGGASDRVARIPSALFTFATVLVIFFVANYLFRPRTGLLSGLILATTGEYFRVAHWVIVDTALTFFVVSAMALFITGYLAGRGRTKFLCYILMYVAATLAFYSKGFIGIVIPGLSILVFLAVERNFREILKMRLWLGILVFLLMTLPWFIALWQQGGMEHLKVFFVHNHLQRFFPAGMAGRISGEASGHHKPFYFYLIDFPSGFLPWSLLLIPVLYHVFSMKERSYGSGTLQDKGRFFGLCWFLTGITFLSLASTKRTLYLMPVFAPISILTASYIDSTIASGSLHRVGKIFLSVFSLLLLTIGLGLTPAYFYLKKVYFQTLPGSLLATTLVVSMLVIIISLAGIFYLQRRKMSRYWIAISLPVVLILIFTLVSIVPALDKYKSFVPFFNKVATLVPADKPLYAYDPDETLRGAVPFYTGRFVIEIDAIGNELFSKEKPFYIIIRDRMRIKEKDILSTNKLFMLAKHSMGLDRALVLFSNMPVQNTMTISDNLENITGNRMITSAVP